jgi:hypothetical protein
MSDRYAVTSREQLAEYEIPGHLVERPDNAGPLYNLASLRGDERFHGPCPGLFHAHPS